MKFDIGGNPDYGDLTVVLQPGESIWAESGAMSRMSSHLSMKSHIIGGTMQGLFRKVLGGQSLFVGEYTASQMGFIALSPAFPGSILHRQIDAESLWLTAGSFSGLLARDAHSAKVRRHESDFFGRGDCAAASQRCRGFVFWRLWRGGRTRHRWRVHRRYRPRCRLGTDVGLHHRRHGRHEANPVFWRGSRDAIPRTWSNLAANPTPAGAGWLAGALLHLAGGGQRGNDMSFNRV